MLVAHNDDEMSAQDLMPRRLRRLPSSVPAKADVKVEAKVEEQGSESKETKGERADETLQNPRPGTRLPNGKRVPPPPPPKGTFVPKGPRTTAAAIAEAGNAHLDALKAKVQLRTRAECERVCEKVFNWMKNGLVSANLGNAMTNTVRAVLQSKTATEEMELRVADRELMRRIAEMEDRVGAVETAAGIEEG